MHISEVYLTSDRCTHENRPVSRSRCELSFPALSVADGRSSYMVYNTYIYIYKCIYLKYISPQTGARTRTAPSPAQDARLA